MRLLLAYDGSECADSAINDLTHAGLPTRGEARVMAVAEVWLPPPPPSAQEIVAMATLRKGALGLERKYMAASRAVIDADAMSEKAASRFKSLFPAWKVKHEAVWGSPTWELFSKAEDWNADLIVAGSHGRSALGRLFLGSISQWLLNEARCSVRVARGKVDEPDSPVRLLLALDGSRNAEKALAQIAARNWPAKSEVRVVTVDQPLEPTYVGSVAQPLKQSVASINKKEHTRSQRLVDAAVKKLKASGLRATGQVWEGDPKRMLVKVAEDWRADCIFLGATGLSNRLERFLLGSTAGAVAARAHCSVEVVRTRRRKRKTNGNGP
ncbi:MAG TPA: universal stress protein [Pyrinomonadaceae bacterium]